MTARHIKTWIIAAMLLFSIHASAQFPVLAPVPKMQFLDGDGHPLAGGKVYTYLAGTTSAYKTYTSISAGLNTNPIILDSGGFANIWLDTTVTYKFIIKTSADVTVNTVDHIAPTCSVIGCAYIGNVIMLGDGTSWSLQVSNSNLAAILVTETGSGANFGVDASASSATGTAIRGAAIATSGANFGVVGTSASASGIGVLAQNTNASGKLISGLNSAGVEKFSVANTGALSIAGGTALTTTNQTGSSNIVLSTAPQIDSPQFTTQITVGLSGTPVKKIISATATLDFPNIPANTSATLNITGITGVVAGDGCNVMPLGAPESGLVWSCFCGTDLITVVVGNVTTGAIDPASRTWRGTGSKF